MDNINKLAIYYVPDVPLQIASPAAAESAQHGQGEVPQPAGASTLQGAGHPGTGGYCMMIIELQTNDLSVLTITSTYCVQVPV